MVLLAAWLAGSRWFYDGYQAVRQAFVNQASHVDGYYMASPWYSLASQKLYLAQVLIARFEQSIPDAGLPPAVVKEAQSQAVAELLIRARAVLLTMIARLHQKKTETPQTLADLQALLPYEVAELTALEALAQERGSWWNHLAQLDKALGQPPAIKKTVSAENIIAVATEDGPDRSLQALEKTRIAMAAFARELEDRHSEW